MEGLLDNLYTIGRELRDVLLFRRLIGPTLLIGIYYVGAVAIPFFAWWAGRRLIAIARPVDGIQGWEGQGAMPVDPGLRRRVWTVAVVLFIVMEVFWRLGFEFGIAYFQMHDALTRP
jgi:hypothetical protein